MIANDKNMKPFPESELHPLIWPIFIRFQRLQLFNLRLVPTLLKSSSKNKKLSCLKKNQKNTTKNFHGSNSILFFPCQSLAELIKNYIQSGPHNRFTLTSPSPTLIEFLKILFCLALHVSAFFIPCKC